MRVCVCLFTHLNILCKLRNLRPSKKKRNKNKNQITPFAVWFYTLYFVSSSGNYYFVVIKLGGVVRPRWRQITSTFRQIFMHNILLHNNNNIKCGSIALALLVFFKKHNEMMMIYEEIDRVNTAIQVCVIIKFYMKSTKIAFDCGGRTFAFSSSLA